MNDHSRGRHHGPDDRKPARHSCPASRTMTSRRCSTRSRCRAGGSRRSNGLATSSPLEEPSTSSICSRSSRAPGRRSGKVTRSTFRAPPWWPVAAEPDYALEPPPGSQCFHLKGTATKVIAFAMFASIGQELAREVARVARQQLQQGNFTPVFLTDAKDPEAFRRNRYVFEYFPDRVRSAGGCRQRSTAARPDRGQVGHRPLHQSRHSARRMGEAQ